MVDACAGSPQTDGAGSTGQNRGAVRGAGGSDAYGEDPEFRERVSLLGVQWGTPRPDNHFFRATSI